MLPKPQLSYWLNEVAFQRPFTNQIIEDFSFWGLSTNLHETMEFVKATKGFGSVWLGNKDFKMETGDPVLDAKNYETLTLVLKKTQKVVINRIDRTHMIMTHIAQNAESFQHIVSITLECQTKYIKQIVLASELRGLKSLTLHQAYFDTDSYELMKAA